MFFFYYFFSKLSFSHFENEMNMKLKEDLFN